MGFHSVTFCEAVFLGGPEGLVQREAEDGTLAEKSMSVMNHGDARHGGEEDGSDELGKVSGWRGMDCSPFLGVSVAKK